MMNAGAAKSATESIRRAARARWLKVGRVNKMCGGSFCKRYAYSRQATCLICPSDVFKAIATFLRGFDLSAATFGGWTAVVTVSLACFLGVAVVAIADDLPVKMVEGQPLAA